MNILIVGIIILLVIGGSCALGTYSDGGFIEWGVVLGGMFFAGIIMTILFSAIATGIGENYIKYKSKNEIVSVQDNQVTQGRISGGLFVFSGTIDGVAKYFYYEKTAEGGYVLKNVNATNAVIYQDEQENPYINIFQEHKKGNKFWMSDDRETGYTIIDFHIPKGSIIKEFNLDAK